MFDCVLKRRGTIQIAGDLVRRSDNLSKEGARQLKRLHDVLRAVDAAHQDLKHGLYHLEQSNLDDEGRHGIPNLRSAAKKLNDALRRGFA